MIEIPYSIALVGDKNFTIILKHFEEPHSFESLQKILDCIFIKRPRTNIANSLNFAIQNMKYPDDTRNQRIIFFFTNGMDENLVHLNDWGKVFNNKKL
jgi:hypothetical protein